MVNYFSSSHVTLTLTLTPTLTLAPMLWIFSTFLTMRCIHLLCMVITTHWSVLHCTSVSYRSEHFDIVATLDNGEEGSMRLDVSVSPSERITDAINKAAMKELGRPVPSEVVLRVEEAIIRNREGHPYEHVLQSEHDTLLCSRTGSLIDLKQHLGYTRYLEIGCSNNNNFAWLSDEFEPGEALCVDPGMGGTHRMTSDDFFRQYQGPPFDLIFIDGLHLSEQVLTDVRNSLEWLSPDGTIVLHDCNPRAIQHVEARHMGVGQVEKTWNGDVYRAVLQLRQKEDIDVAVGDFDYGVGMIRRRPNTSKLVIESIPSKWGTGYVTNEEWVWFRQNREQLLRLLPYSDILDWASAYPTTSCTG